MSVYWSGFHITPSVIALAGLMLTVGCNGAGSHQMPPDAQDDPSTEQSGLLNFPSPALLNVSAAGTNGSNFKAASEYDGTLPSQQIGTWRQILYLNPEKAEDAFAYAMFSFPNVDPTLAPQVELGLQYYISEHYQSLFLGLANYETGSWKWFPLESNIVEFGNLAPYISENGSFLAAVVSIAPIQIAMSWVRLGTREWVVETIDVGTVNPGHIAAAMDSNDRPRFCFNGKYCYLTDDGWVIEENGSGIGTVHQLILDENDKPHVCGSGSGGDWGMGTYAYATRQSIYWDRPWGIAVSTPANQIGSPFVSMDFDSNGLPHFAYYVESRGAQEVPGLYYSGPVGDGTWTEELVDNEGETGHQCEIALDASDNPLIAYHGDNHREGRMTYLDGAVWQTEVRSEVYAPGVSLGILADDSPLLVFEGNDLILQNLTNDWSYENLGKSSKNGCLMQLKQDGTPSILHKPFTSFIMQIKSWKAGKWDERWVDLPDRQEYPIYPNNDGFMLDSNDRPHLIYVPTTNGPEQLCYAHLE